MKRLCSILTCLALFLSLLPASALAVETEEEQGIFLEEDYELGTIETSAMPGFSFLTLDDSGKAAMKTSNEVDWINRLDLTGADFATSFYEALEEAADNDGSADWLIDPVTYGTLYENTTYRVEIAEETGTISAGVSATGTDDNTAKNALNSVISGKISDAYNTWKASITPYVTAIWGAFDRDHPEVFWLTGNYKTTGTMGGSNYSLSYSTTDNTVTATTTTDITYTLTYYLVLQTTDFDVRDADQGYTTVQNIKNDISDLNTKITSITNGCTATTTYGKVQYFNDWLTENNQYNTTSDSDYPSSSRNPLTALEGNTGIAGPVCEGYARAFKLLCDNANIPCVLVDGYASSDGENGEAHMWNYTQMDDKNWYGVDVTWNDPVMEGETASENGTSGNESEGYLLVGANTENSKNVTFSASHPASNTPMTSGPSFTNGPVLADYGYIDSITVSELTAPVKGETPDTVVTLANDTLTISDASVSWTDNDGNAVSGTFGAGTVYKATIAVNAENVKLGSSSTGYKPSSATTVTCTGSQSATVSDGSIVITFPATGSLASQNISVTGGILVKDALTQTYGDEAATLTVSNNSENGGTLSVASNDTTVATAALDNGTLTITPVNKGTATITITAAGTESYAETTKTITVTVVAKTLTNNMVTLDDTTFIYNGSDQHPNVTVTDGDTPLSKGTDYTVVYSNNTNAGTDTATVIVTGKGNYGGEVIKTFKINAKSISGAEVTLSADSFGYTGAAIEPTVSSVTLDGKTLTAGTDYTVAYSNNVNAGTATATVTIKGKGNYGGEVSKNFTISAKALTNDMVTPIDTLFIYDGSDKELSVTVKDGNTTLRKGTDYTVSYSNNVNAGTATLTIEGKGNYGGEISKNFTITAKSVAVTWSNTDLTYTGGQQAPTATADGLTLTVSGGATNVGTYTATASTSNTNYTLTNATTDFSIKAKELTNVVVTVAEGTYTYTGSAIEPRVDVKDGTTALTKGTDYTVAYSNNINAGIATLTVSPVTGSNYTFTPESRDFSILSAEQNPTILDGVVTVGGKLDLTTLVSGDYKGTPTFRSDTDGLTIENNVLSVASTTKTGSYNITLTISAHDVNGDDKPEYKEYTRKNVEISVTDKLVPTVSASDITVTYTGEAVSASAIQGTATYDGQPVEGTWGFSTNNTAPTDVSDSGTYTVFFAPTDTETYVGIVTTTITITINKATPTGTPGYTKITTSGKTLADAALNVGTITPAGGQIAWDLAVDTTVAANTAYAWTYTPTDPGNYNLLTGSITLYSVSSGGSGGGGGGGASSSTSTTTKNEDGSSTTTTTNPSTGTVTETTKNTDGSTTTVVTTKDGTVTTTEKTTEGIVTETVETTDGTVTTEVTLPKETVSADEVVALPMPAVTLSSSSERAPTITVNTGSRQDVTVVIPTTETTPGTVAIIVHEDGTEEVVRTSVAEEGGLTVAVSDGTTLKVVDNSKDFDDVDASDWHKNAVDFASGHELFNGTSEKTFSPDHSMTRGMLVQVLYNLENNPDTDFDSQFDDVSNDAWYSDAVTWASGLGVVTGYADGSFGADNSITREQLAVMLWRYAGSPESGHALNGFADGHQISNYAQQAMAWANELGIVNGKPGGILDPKGSATRAQVAQVLMNWMQNLNRP